MSKKNLANDGIDTRGKALLEKAGFNLPYRQLAESKDLRYYPCRSIHNERVFVSVYYSFAKIINRIQVY